MGREVMAKGEGDAKLNFPDDETEVQKKRKSSEYIGVTFHKKGFRWGAFRWSREECRTLHNGNYDNEEEAAYASDTLARKLMANGEENIKLNFPDDNTEVHKKRKSSTYIGVSFHKQASKWGVIRWSKKE